MQQQLDLQYGKEGGNDSKNINSLFKPVGLSGSVCICVFTLQQRGYEGRGHAAGAEQNSVAHLKLPFWDPTKDHSCHSCQKPHHCGLNLEQKGGGSNYWVIILYMSIINAHLNITSSYLFSLAILADICYYNTTAGHETDD